MSLYIKITKNDKLASSSRTVDVKKPRKDPSAAFKAD